MCLTTVIKPLIYRFSKQFNLQLSQMFGKLHKMFVIQHSADQLHSEKTFSATVLYKKNFCFTYGNQLCRFSTIAICNQSFNKIFVSLLQNYKAFQNFEMLQSLGYLLQSRIKRCVYGVSEVFQISSHVPDDSTISCLIQLDALITGAADALPR